MMAGLIGLTLVPATLMVQDHPPGAPALSVDPRAPAPDSLSVGEIVRRPAFWMLALTAGAVITGIMVLTFNMIPLAQSLGLSRDQGAVLQSAMSLSGMAGSILFGWIADRIGGARGIALLAFNMAVLIGLMLLRPPFPVMLVVVGLFGLHGAGMVPNVSRALATSLGQDSFSRAFGLQSALSVPLTATGLVAMGAAFDRTGSYAPALMAVAALMLVMAPLAFAARRLTAR